MSATVPATEPRPTWDDARAKVWRQPGHATPWTHADPADRCSSVSAAHRTYATAVVCERSSL